MKKIALIFANGTEEIEALTPKDVLFRAGVKCDIVSVSGITPVGSHDIKVVADLTEKDFNIDEYDGIIIPGGMPGSVNIKNSDIIKNAVIKAFNDKKLVAGICASPAVCLKNFGVTKGKKVTCYPAEVFYNEFTQETYTAKDVEVDGNLVTANGIKSAMAFSLAICDFLGVTPKF